MAFPKTEENPEASRPVPPEKPLPGDCCDTGCEICVFDAYADALREYQLRLAKWLNSQCADSDPDSTKPESGRDRAGP